MSDFAFDRGLTPQFLSSLSQFAAGRDLRYSSGLLSTASGAWPTANMAYYIPFAIPWPYAVRRLWWLNGSAAGGNWGVGLYTANGARLYASASTPGSGNSVPQYVSPSAPILLSPGRYYMHIAHDAVTANRAIGSTVPTAVKLRMAGIVQQAAALTAPSPMVAAAMAAAWFPYCGLTRTASGF